MKVIRRALVRGRVQGVGFRAFVEYAAAARALEGWVRNRRDGSVEAVFAGPPAAVAQAVEACRAGPPGARVDALDEHEALPAELDQRHAGDRFSILPTV
jgi:acylphosphatase